LFVYFVFITTRFVVNKVIQYYMQGHSEELWAIAGHPTEPEFVTAGYDQIVMLWHSDTHRLLWKTPVEVTYSPLSLSMT